jgi:hypothetical protein
MKVAVKVVAGFAALLVLIGLTAAFYTYMTALEPARPVGFQQIAAVDPGHAGIPIAVWYPSTGRTLLSLLQYRALSLPRQLIRGTTFRMAAKWGARTGSSTDLVMFPAASMP